MDGSRLTKYDARQLFTWASVGGFLLLLGIQFFAFSDGEIIGRAPAEVRTAREKLRAVDEARQAFARLDTVDLAVIPVRDYAAIDPKTIAAAADESEDVEEMESYDLVPEVVAAPAEIVPPPPVLKGILQSRDASGQVTLRASYPQRIVVEGESIAGYLVQQITVERVTLAKNGETIVQQVAESHLTRKR